ncbi:MAG: discoidin domain-containing protein, partial [Planctomycetes bacterium]|nr:discoidin domain-containing protein [Planctomycetota bacterium]
TPEGTPHVFRAPPSALDGAGGRLPDKKGYGFDGCSPRILMDRAEVRDGLIVFPDGSSYRLLVLPNFPTMTPQLLAKIKDLVEAGASVVGYPPAKSPSLANYPACDEEVQSLAKELWGDLQAPPKPPAAQRTASTSSPGYPLQLALDRNPKTRWISDGDKPGEGPTPEAPEHIDWEFPTPFPAASLAITPNADCGPKDCELQYSDDGKTFQTISRFVVEQDKEKTVAFDERNAKLFRLVITSSYPFQGEESWNVQISEIALRKVGQEPVSRTTPRPIVRRAHGAGSIYWIPWGDDSSEPLYPHYDDTAAVLKKMGVREDFSATGPVRYAHRRTEEREIYFVSNRSGQPVRADCTFRVVAGQPELWNPRNGQRRPLPQYQNESGRTTIPMEFAPHESFFVVFPRGDSSGSNKSIASGVNFPKATTVTTLQGSWEVSFDPKWGGPEKVAFDPLQDWTGREEEGIKYYSGIATYRKSFDRPAPLAPNAKIYLGLGTVHEMARVRLNGKDLGVVWCAPWRVDITRALQAGANHLEIEVANLWPNRLIGDASKPKEERLTRTTSNPYNAGSTLLPSGLLGPVTVQADTP